jgi:hypothetical protein
MNSPNQELLTADRRFLTWVKRKHEDNPEFQEIGACKTQFSSHPNRDKNIRSEIYSQVRSELEAPDMRRLRAHAMLRCRS